LTGIKLICSSLHSVIYSNKGIFEGEGALLIACVSAQSPRCAFPQIRHTLVANKTIFNGN